MSRVHITSNGFKREFTRLHRISGPSIAHPFMCAPKVWHFVIDSALFDFVLTWERVACFLSTTSQTKMYFNNRACCVRPNPRLDAHAFSLIHCRHGSRESPRTPALSRRVSSPSLRQFQWSKHTILLRWSTSSLTVVFVTMQKGFALPQLHCSTACALASHGLPWQVAVCAHVHGLWVYQMMSIKLSLLLGHRSSIV